MIFAEQIHATQRMNPLDFDDQTAFAKAPASGHNFSVYFHH